jgi:hypothetical protein
VTQHFRESNDLTGDILLLDAGLSLGAWLRDGGRFSISDKCENDLPISDNRPMPSLSDKAMMHSLRKKKAPRRVPFL